MSGDAGQHITVRMVMWLPGFFMGSNHMSNPYLHPYSSCAKLPSGEEMLLACFSSGKISEKSVEISPRFCYNIDVSLCSRAGVKNPRWQADIEHGSI